MTTENSKVDSWGDDMRAYVWNSPEDSDEEILSMAYYKNDLEKS